MSINFRLSIFISVRTGVGVFCRFSNILKTCKQCFPLNFSWKKRNSISFIYCLGQPTSLSTATIAWTHRKNIYKCLHVANKFFTPHIPPYVSAVIVFAFRFFSFHFFFFVLAFFVRSDSFGNLVLWLN